MPFHPRQGTAEDVDDDDKASFVYPDGPPLTHTFHLEMTPRSFAAPTASQDGSPRLSTSVTASPPASPMESDKSVPLIQSRPHGKRRDPSYIPRPPNAFILFRSAFIRDQNIPGKVEGNHSKLSKIIGFCWKQLPREEREKWEARAIDAQAEHRTRYPDWRFRPGSNARLKVGESNASTTRRRSVQRRAKGSPAKDGDGAESEGKVKKDKGKAKAKTSRIASIEETRCAKIAGFVAEGLKGDELEIAVRQWEGDRRISRPEIRPKKSRAAKSRVSLKKHPRSQSNASPPPSLPSSSPAESQSDLASNGSTPTHTRIVRTPTLEESKPVASTSKPILDNNNPSTIGLSTVPLTHMFKRFPSTPISNERLSYPRSSSENSDESSLEDASQSSTEPSTRTWGTILAEATPTRTHTNPHTHPDSISLPISSSSSTARFDTPPVTWQQAENPHRLEEIESWWSGRSSSEARSEFGFGDHKERDAGAPIVFTTENMGYEAHGSGTQYDRAFMEQFRSFEPARDGSQDVQWTDLSTTSVNRQGLAVIIDDPYKDDCDDNSPPPLSHPQPLSLAPMPSSGFYYSDVSQSPSSTNVPPSSYSALSGWDGDYKSHALPEATMKPWSDHLLSNPPPGSPSATDSSPWFNNNQGIYNWTSRPQLQPPLSIDTPDWDRHERRAPNEIDIPVEPRPELDFHDDLRRLQGGS